MKKKFLLKRKKVSITPASIIWRRWCFAWSAVDAILILNSLFSKTCCFLGVPVCWLPGHRLATHHSLNWIQWLLLDLESWGRCVEDLHDDPNLWDVAGHGHVESLLNSLLTPHLSPNINLFLFKFSCWEIGAFPLESKGAGGEWNALIKSRMDAGTAEFPYGWKMSLGESGMVSARHPVPSSTDLKISWYS